ncbi:hypothetical protein M3Y96_00687300 [Aphelenchoides besseyi]|nr:hypothetical protein M3Y96_00687300 [Aphelenchoides besseyi]
MKKATVFAQRIRVVDCVLDDAKVAYPTVDDEWEKHDDLKPTDNKSMLVRKMVQAKERTGRHRKRRQQRKRLNGKIVKNV